MYIHANKIKDRELFQHQMNALVSMAISWQCIECPTNGNYYTQTACYYKSEWYINEYKYCRI